jgi:ribosomal protein S18 acetylase RimI-like enzyme
MAITARAVTEGDLDLICRQREEMFRDAGRDEQILLRMTGHFRAWLKPRLADGSYFGYILTDGDLPVAGVGLILIDWPPHPMHPEQDRRGYILNVFVEPAYRRRGLARELMRLSDDEFARRGVDYSVLHATEKGNALYSQLGWAQTTEMAKTVEPG